jgi:alkylation response protein AidB-like acyl-CoA dehydrogenase
MPPADLTDLQRQIATAAEDLAEAEFAGQAFDWQGETPWENVRTLADKGFYCVAIPEEYGGGGLSVFEDILVIESATPVCPDTGWAVMNATIAPRYVAYYGSEAAKER